MDLRTEERQDRAAVRRLHVEAFGEHGQVVADLVDDLRDQITPDNGLSLVAAEAANGVTGHLMLTRSLLDAPRQLVQVRCLTRSRCCPPGSAKGSAPR